MNDASPGTRKLILAGVAVALPLAAVAIYFSVFDQPAPAPPLAQTPAPQAAPGGQLPPDHPPIAGQPGGARASTGPSAPTEHPQIGGGRSIRVPEEVRGKWRAIKLRVEEKGGGKPPQTVTVKLGDQLDIPGSKLRIRVSEFLPALQVSGNEITSGSNNPTNPAAMVAVSEGGREIFKGWLFAKFPEMQPFEHPTYRITLLEGVPAG
jgi:hypothetical protein